MPIVATYESAKLLRDKLTALGIKFKPETFNMKTSGIYIPTWLNDGVPYELDGDSVKWFFFYRFENGHKDLNVGEALLYVQEHGLHKLAHRINNKQQH